MLLKQHICLFFIYFVNASSEFIIKTPSSPSVNNQKQSTSILNNKCDTVTLLSPSNHFSGYIQLPHKPDSQFFYMYFENRKQDPKAPLIYWTNGGPGQSSLVGIFRENGPYKIQEDLTLCWNEYGWDIDYNILYIDQPIGTGFSYTTNESDYIKNEAGVAEDVIYFFHEFLKLHPELNFKPLFLTGESYAGHYLPAIAYKLIEAIDTGFLQVSFMGFAIGNPYMSPREIYKSHPLYAVLNDLITEEQGLEILKSFPNCNAFLSLCDPTKWYSTEFLCAFGYDYCISQLSDPIMELNPNLNKYDIRLEKAEDTWFDLTLITEYLNLPDVKKQLKVKEDMIWKDGNPRINEDLKWDHGIDTSGVFSQMLKSNISLFIFVGDKDLGCNYIGCENWLDKLQWPQQQKWINESLSDLYVDGNFVGLVKQVDNLKYARIFDAGHQVPLDQPKVALDIIRNYVSSVIENCDNGNLPFVELNVY